MDSSFIPVLQIQNLRVHFYQKGSAGIQMVKAVDGIDLSLYRGRTLCLVGEANSGKSAACRALAGARRGVSGRMRLAREGCLVEVVDLPGGKCRESSVMLVAEKTTPSISTLRAAGSRAIQAVQRSHIINVEEISGCAVIERALECKPSVLIVDDPAAVLNDSEQAQMLDRISAAQQETGMAVLYATRDLDLAARLADEVAVIQRGKIVEMANTHTLFTEPKHPYTQALLAGVPGGRSFLAVRPPSGCFYQACCPLAESGCAQFEPRLVTVSERHDVRCFACETLPVEPLVSAEPRESGFDVWQIECFLMR